MCTLRSRCGCVLLIIVLLFTYAGCAHTVPNSASTLDPRGEIVLGVASAQLWGLEAGVAYEEVSATAVPSSVREAVGEWARSHSYDERCARFFTADSLYVIGMTAFCYNPQEHIVLPDHVELATFDTGGRLRGEWIADYWDPELRIIPLWRPAKIGR